MINGKQVMTESAKDFLWRAATASAQIDGDVCRSYNTKAHDQKFCISLRRHN